MQLYRRDDSPYWWCWVFLPDGQRKRVSTRRSDRRAAEQAARRLQREAEDPNFGQQSETVAEALDAFLGSLHGLATKTQICYGGRAIRIAEVIGKVPLSRLDRDAVTAYFNVRRRAGAKRGTLKLEAAVLKLMLRSAQQRGRFRGIISDIVPPIRGTSEPRARWLTLEEFGRLYAALLPHRRLWLAVAVFTGARLSEVDSLRWEHVDFEAGLIRIPGTKTPKSKRVVPLSSELRALLSGIQGLPTEPVVRRWPGCWEALKRMTEKLGMPRASAHDLRRTFASWLAQAGVSERIVADLLGHTKTDLTRTVYVHLRPDDYRQAIDAMPRLQAKEE